MESALALGGWGRRRFVLTNLLSKHAGPYCISDSYSLRRGPFGLDAFAGTNKIRTSSMPPDDNLGRALALLSFLLLIVDVLGGMTPIWQDEAVRVLFSRIRLAFDIMTLATWLLACAAPAHLSVWFTPLHAVLLAIVTLGGAATATVCQFVGPHGQHEWIFAVESGGVFGLLSLWLIVARRYRSRAYSRYSSREGDLTNIVTAAARAQRDAIGLLNGSSAGNSDAALLLEGALHDLEGAGLGGDGSACNSLTLGIIEELARVRVEQNRLAEALSLQQRLVRGCEAGTRIGGHAQHISAGAVSTVGEDLATAQRGLAAILRRVGREEDAAAIDRGHPTCDVLYTVPS
jgi:hypothetical protein